MLAWVVSQLLLPTKTKKAEIEYSIDECRLLIFEGKRQREANRLKKPVPLSGAFFDS
jgi:hypothetical protein